MGKRGRSRSAGGEDAPRSAANPTGAARPKAGARGGTGPAPIADAPAPGTAGAPVPDAPERPDTRAAMSRGYARGRERDEEIRRALKPLDGERPGAVTVAAVVAIVLALANVVAAVAGADIADQDNATQFTVISTAILLVAGVGMWMVKYWAVLGFQVLLTFQIIILSVALIRVEKWWVGLIVLTAIGLGGWLFWKLVRAMARIQMPTRQ